MNDMFVRRRSQVSGPFPVEEIKAQIARGELVPLHELSHDGIEWIRAGKIWEEFVPKPQSIIEMAERRPVVLKPVIDPVDMHKGHSLVSREEKARDEKSKAERHDRLPTSAAKTKASQAKSSNSEHDEEPPTLPAGKQAIDDSADGHDELAVERTIPPEPAVGAKALRGLAIIVASSALAGMVLSITCIALDLRTLDKFAPPTLDRLSQIYASGMFAVSDFVRVLLLVFKAFFFTLFLAWIYFFASFLYGKSQGKMRFTPGWSVGWFLVPILNLWKPYKVVSELERRSEQYLRFDDPRIIRDPVVGVWWTCWVLEMFALCFLLLNRDALAQIVRLDGASTPEQVERLRQVPKLVYDFHTNEIACLCVAFVSGIATLVLLYRFERVRPKWETQSRRRRPA